MKIRHEFSQESIRLERSRDLAAMSIGDLFWCFATRVVFVDDESNETLLTTRETTFFHILTSFVETVEAIRFGGNIERTIEDLEGSFSLTFRSDGVTVSIVQDIPPQSFAVPLDELVKATHSWISEAKKNIQEVYPDLKNNPLFETLTVWQYL